MIQQCLESFRNTDYLKDQRLAIRMVNEDNDHNQVYTTNMWVVIYLW